MLPSSITATATYSDSTTKSVSAALYTAADTTTAGVYQGTIVYEGATGTVEVIVYETENAVSTADALKTAIGNASADEIIVLSGDITTAETLAIDNEGVRIVGNGAKITTAETDKPIFSVTASNAVIEGIAFETTATSGTENLIRATNEGTGLTVRGCTFTGGFDVATNTGATTRGFELSVNDFVIEDCTFINVRQPGYINEVQRHDQKLLCERDSRLGYLRRLERHIREQRIRKQRIRHRYHCTGRQHKQLHRQSATDFQEQQRACPGPDR